MAARRLSCGSSCTSLGPCMPSSASLPRALPHIDYPTPLHELLLYHPELSLTFPVTDVVNVLHESPIPNSQAGAYTETRVKIAEAGRDTFIRAAEMTADMQGTLRDITANEVLTTYRVSRSTETGTRGLYNLVKIKQNRPRSLVLPNVLFPSAAPKSPRTSNAPSRLLALIAPKLFTPGGSPAPRSPNSDDDVYFDGQTVYA